MFATAGAGMSFAAANARNPLDQSSAEETHTQKAALEAITSVLLSAGYFRARIPQLSAFDKVVGGLCWAITSSGAAVDVDIFYDDELALGAKIQLGETIIRTLRAMGCPYPLQAHQIRDVDRADFVAIFPVVQWLVKKVLEHRKVTGDYVRMRSETAFAQRFTRATSAREIVNRDGSAADEPLAPGVASLGVAAGAMVKPSISTSALDYIETVEARYQPSRKYRRHPATWAAMSSGLAADARVQSCLLEFGERTVVKVTTDEDDAGAKGRDRAANEFERKFASLQRAARAEEEEKRRAAVEREKDMLQSMLEAKAGVSGSSVGLLMEMQSEELRRAAEEYRAKEEELRALADSGDLMANTKVGRAAAHARRVAALQQRIAAAEATRQEAQSALSAVESQITTLREAVTKSDKYNAKAAAQIAKLDAQIAALPPEQQEMARKLFDALVRAEELKEQEERFRASCGQHRDELQARLAALRADGAVGDTAQRVAELQAIEADAKARLARAKAAVAERTRALAKLARQVDEFPSQDELMQYNKRFLELFDEVSEKLDETRKYFAIYNMLERKRQFIVKEESLLASMLSNHTALKNKAQKQAYLDQCASIVESIRDTVAKQSAQLDAKKSTRDAKSSELQRLVEAQRAYFKAVKEFQDECERNDALQARVSAASRT